MIKSMSNMIKPDSYQEKRQRDYVFSKMRTILKVLMVI
jgi:hypothetical protein